MHKFLQENQLLAVAGMAGLFAVLYTASMLINASKRKKLAASGVDHYSSEEVRSHTGHERHFILTDPTGMPRTHGGKAHPEYGELVMAVGGRPLKNLGIALGVLSPLALLWLAGGTAAILADGELYWYAALAFLSAYALYRLYIGTSQIRLYRRGMVAGPLFFKRATAYSAIAQMQGYDYLKRRGNKPASYRRAWACRIVLKDGRVLEYNDSRYWRARYRLTRWMESLQWVPNETAAS